MQQQSILIRLIEKYRDDPIMVGLIAFVMQDDQKYSNHYALMKHIREKHLDNGDTDEYRITYHEFMYENVMYVGKVWFNSRREQHCDLRGPDGLVLPAVVSGNGSQYWKKNGNLHSYPIEETNQTQPAIVKTFSKYWFKHGELHRDDVDKNGRILPAHIWDGGEEWFRKGKIHRSDVDENGQTLPAFVKTNGEKTWYRKGKYHRTDFGDDGKVLPASIMPNGNKFWYYKGESYTQDDLTAKLKKKQTVGVLRTPTLMTVPSELSFAKSSIEIETTDGNKFIIHNVSLLRSFGGCAPK